MTAADSCTELLTVSSPLASAFTDMLLPHSYYTEAVS